MPFLAYTVLVLFFAAVCDAKVRNVEMKLDEVVPIRTAVGLATIIQVPDRPNSIVLGDQDAFKVEYLDQAITIKPLRPSAHTNLYIYTDYRRFNIELITASQANADYVVYLKNFEPKKTSQIVTSPKWTSINKSITNHELTFEILRATKLKSTLVVEFKISSLKPVKFEPSWLWAKQKNQTKPIANLLLSEVLVTKDIPLHGSIELALADLRPDQDLVIELRREQASSIRLPKPRSFR